MTAHPIDLWTTDFKGHFRTRDGIYPLAFRGREPVAGDQEPRVLAGDRQRVTVDVTMSTEGTVELNTTATSPIRTTSQRGSSCL
jgi:hypothetical protein